MYDNIHDLQIACQILQQTKERVASYPNHPYTICSKIQNLMENDRSISNSDYSYLLFTSKEEQYAWNQWKPYSLHSSSSFSFWSVRHSFVYNSSASTCI